MTTPGAGLLTLTWLAAMCTIPALAAAARAETFEHVSYTPPAGWATQQDATGRLYQRKDATGTGVVMLFTSRAAGGAPAEAFAVEWREKVQPLVSQAAPRPEVRQVGDLTAAIAASRAQVNGADVTVTFVTLVGRGRALSVLGMASGDEALRQQLAFFDTLAAASAASAATAAPTAPPAADGGGDLELDVDAPPGYTSRREAGGLRLSPVNRDRSTPCVYGVTPPRASRGSQEADAQAAFAEIFAGWQKSRAEEHNYLKRGVAPAGWSFTWYRADLKRGVTQLEHAIAMVMVLPAARGRVNVVWGLGDLAQCTFEDRSFALLFHGLRPRGVPSDGGKALVRDLVGSWIYSTSAGNHNAMVYQFDAAGGFVYALNVVTSRIEVSDATAIEQRAKLGKQGRYTLRGNVIELLHEGRDKPDRYRVRIMDERSLGRWTRALYLTDESGNDVQYLRQDWKPPGP